MKPSGFWRTTLLIFSIIPSLLAMGGSKQSSTSKLLPIDISVLGTVPRLENERKSWSSPLMNKLMPIDTPALGLVSKIDNERNSWLVGSDLSVLNSPSPHHSDERDLRTQLLLDNLQLPFEHRVKDALWDFLADADELEINNHDVRRLRRFLPYDDEYQDDYMYYYDDEDNNLYQLPDGDQSNIIPLTKKAGDVEDTKRNVFVSESWRPGGHANVAMKNIVSHGERGEKTDRAGGSFATVFGPNGWRLGYGKRAFRRVHKRVAENKDLSTAERGVPSDKIDRPTLVMKEKWKVPKMLGTYW